MKCNFNTAKCGYSLVSNVNLIHLKRKNSLLPLFHFPGIKYNYELMGTKLHIIQMHIYLCGIASSGVYQLNIYSMCCCIANVSVNLVSSLENQSTSLAIMAESDDLMNVREKSERERESRICLRNDTNETAVPPDEFTVKIKSIEMIVVSNWNCTTTDFN